MDKQLSKEIQRTSQALNLSAEEILQDYRLAYQSRQVSLIGRREVLGGKAKFGIFGDGKEVAQLAMAKVFRKGDFRSGYYRDQTFILAAGMGTIQEYFAQLYAHADVAADPYSAGRSMNAHFGSRSLNPDGTWKHLSEMLNSSSDVSPTGSQMPRLVGLAYASRLYRELDELKSLTQFSHNGDEIAFGTIGNATCAEGMFWEALNAAGVLQAPMLLSIWDDGFGISVPNEYQVAKDISELLSGFQRTSPSARGYEIFKVRAWDYAALIETYRKAEAITRREHAPAIIHVVDVTQPQGHSTSGSHERYKSKERMEWEHEYDCVARMRAWMIKEGIANTQELDRLEQEDREFVEDERVKAWEAYRAPINAERDEVLDMLDEIATTSQHADDLQSIKRRLSDIPNPIRQDLYVSLRDALIALREEHNPSTQILIQWKKQQDELNRERYGSHLYSASMQSALNVREVKAVYRDDSPIVNGFEVVNACFDAALARDPRVIAFGEDVGHLGDVNQGFAGLQAKYGVLRVSDTGIRETTIMGQAIGMAMRGLRPIAEIQYLDYILYALQIMSDDLASLHWRTKGGQKAPVIVRTRGHRLEGIWHSGSPIAGVINLIRGMHVLVPRNMTQAAGFYNTMLQSDEPALIIEVLNGYRQKEMLPANIGEFSVPLGVPEVLRKGNDVTVVTYGACVRIAQEAAQLLGPLGVEVELIDVQSLLPFDLQHRIVESIKKTSRVVFLDEDVPGGGSAYMMQQVLEGQDAYHWLDAEPRTLPAQAHRPAYGSDGNYFSKPNVEDVFDAVYSLMHEANPAKYPMFYK